MKLNLLTVINRPASVVASALKARSNAAKTPKIQKAKKKETASKRFRVFAALKFAKAIPTKVM